jgi:16S rRNA (adenine1518-N6/adenine1519-N6)-dimethyltransferase
MQNLKPKKHLGQHFLTDENIAKKIVSLLDSAPQEEVVEIGPGMGVLTKYLLENQSHVHAVEFDDEAITYLKEAFEGHALSVHPADVLKWNPAHHLNKPARWIGNLPYNISSPIMFHLLEHRQWVKKAVFMVQKEVADRLCATPESPVKERGILTVLLDCYFVMKKEIKVPPTVFRPPPKVQSAVFSMVPREGVQVDFPKLKKIVKAAFSQRRKTLRNALKGVELNMESIPPSWMDKRAEELTTADFVKLSEAVR